MSAALISVNVITLASIAALFLYRDMQKNDDIKFLLDENEKIAAKTNEIAAKTDEIAQTESQVLATETEIREEQKRQQIVTQPAATRTWAEYLGDRVSDTKASVLFNAFSAIKWFWQFIQSNPDNRKVPYYKEKLLGWVRYIFNGKLNEDDVVAFEKGTYDAFLDALILIDEQVIKNLIHMFLYKQNPPNFDLQRMIAAIKTLQGKLTTIPKTVMDAILSNPNVKISKAQIVLWFNYFNNPEENTVVELIAVILRNQIIVLRRQIFETNIE